MLQVSILKNGTVSNQATFATQEEADIWLATHNFSGEIEIEDVSEKLEQARINEESLKLLAATDFYIIRELDSGIPCPAEIKQARADARAKIVR